MKYLFPARNLLAEATGFTPVAGSVNARLSATKRGGGMVSLGPDTVDAVIDVEVQNNTIVGTPTVSAPVFRGVGNGVLSGVTADSGLAAQVFTVTLIDLGTDTRKAFAPFQGVTLLAKTAGAGGNDIAITIDESGITRTGTNESLLSPLVENQNDYVGEEWNFGAPVLNPDRTIPATAPRLSFGDDPQVYRQYREYLDGRYVYRFNPAPVRGVAAGARVKVVTGSREVTFDDGVTTRVYSSITTLYSLLNAIQSDASALVDIDGAVVLDYAQNGMAITEMSVRTGAFIQSIERDGTQYIKDADIQFTANETAPTELLAVRCIDASISGAEIWSVKGAVSGDLLNAVTGVDYEDGAYQIAIPAQEAPAIAPDADRSARLELVGVSGGEGGSGDRDEPALCVENFVLGADATAKTFTFTWKGRRAQCSCDGVTVEGGPDAGHLGVDVTGEANMAELIPTALQTRYQTLYDWQSTFVSSQVSIESSATATVTGDSGSPISAGAIPIDSARYDDGTEYIGIVHRAMSAVIKADRVDIDAAKSAVVVFIEALNTAYDAVADNDIPTDALDEWDDAVADLQTDFEAIDDLVGAELWRRWNAIYNAQSSTKAELLTLIQNNAALFFTNEVSALMERYRARMAKFLVLAGVKPDFDDAGRQGNDVWQDHGGNSWFESEDGLLPIQPGHYYHSARTDADGVPVSTREFGIGVGIGCPDALVYGDKLILTISGNGNVRATYQVGDQFTARVIAGGPLELGGGQTGDDTQVWSVRGSVVGAIADYEHYKPAPVAYSDGGLEFEMTTGGIGHALGDQWAFYTEGGQFRYRVNSGSWSSGHQIADTVTHGGHTFYFTPGQAPSWVIGDTYSFQVKALNTLARLVSPRDAGIVTDENELTADYPAGVEAGTTETVLACRVPITESVPLTVEILDVSDNPIETHSFTAQSGDNVWDLTSALINGSGDGESIRVTIGAPATLTASLDWLFLGEPFEFEMDTGLIEHGEFKRSIGLATASRRTRRIGGAVTHTAVSDESVDAFLDLIDDAQINHDGRFAIIPNGAKRAECSIVRIAGEPVVESEDLFNFQPTDPTLRRHSLTLSLEPI